MLGPGLAFCAIAGLVNTASAAPHRATSTATGTDLTSKLSNIASDPSAIENDTSDAASTIVSKLVETDDSKTTEVWSVQ